jgi:hypothetical protein
MLDDKRGDDFWDMPYSRPKRKPHPFSLDTGTVKLDFQNDESNKSDQTGQIPRPGAAAAKKPTLDDLRREGYIVPGSTITKRENEISYKNQVKFEFDNNIKTQDEDVVTQVKKPDSESISEDAAIPSREEFNRRNEPYLRYKPEDNRLIGEVRISMWPSPFTFYERFRSDAKRYYNHASRDCEPAPFFSFMPQYTQLNADQRAWYFRWRSLIRSGKFPASDFGYVMLYIYELINLSDTIEPSSVLNSLCDVWLAYRTQHPRLDRYLSEWVCDLCLINQLPLPYDRLKIIYPQILSAARFKEFYAGCDKGSDSPFAAALFDFNSGYDWRQSKYLTDENRPLFEKHIRGAFIAACRELENTQKQTADINNSVKGDLLAVALRSYGSKLKVIRDAYSGALCSYEIKRRIEVDYSCCTRSPELRFIVTDMVKYAENNVRALLGIKSRFNTPNLPQSARTLIYDYFAPLRAKPGKKGEELPDYERQYEAASASLSPKAALELERRSWETTDRLVRAFSDESAIPNADNNITENNTPSAETTETAEINIKNTESQIYTSFDDSETEIPDFSEQDPNLVLCARAYRLLRAGDAKGFTALAGELNVMPETLAENLNEYSYEIVGDIAAEPDDSGSGWRIVADYAAELDEYFGGTN